MDTNVIMRNMALHNQLMLGGVNAPTQAFQAAIPHLGVLVEGWPEALRGMITERFLLQCDLDALDSRPGTVKNVVAVAP